MCFPCTPHAPQGNTYIYYEMQFNIRCFDISKNILLPSEQKIIKFLALNGPSTRWGIHKGTKIKYQTVHSAMKRLLQKRLFIAIYDVEKARTGFDKPLYFATFVGKLAVMATLENEDDDLDLIATSEPSERARFLIFEEWKYICQSNLARNYVLSIIRTALLDILRTWSFDKLDEAQIQKESANETSIIIIGYSLIGKMLWEGYPSGGVPKLTERYDIFQFFMGNPKLREQIEAILLRVEDVARIIIEEIFGIRRDYGLEMTSEII